MKRAVALLLVASGCGPSTGEGAREPDEVHFQDEPSGSRYPASAEVQRAERLLLEGDAEGAKREIEAALVANIEDPRAHLDMGLVLVAMGDAQGAERSYREALRLAPDFADAMNNLALVLRATDRSAEAKPLLERALQLRPSDTDIAFNLAMVLEETGDLDGAIAAYRRVTRSDDAPLMAQVNLGLALIEKGDRDEASRALARAMGRFEELRGEGAPSEDDGAALAAIGSGFRQLGDGARAVRALEIAMTAEGEFRPGVCTELGAALRLADQRERAEENLARCIREAPRYASAYFVLANMQAGRGAFDEAIRNYRKVLELEPNGEHAAAARERIEQARRASRAH